MTARNGGRLIVGLAANSSADVERVHRDLSVEFPDLRITVIGGAMSCLLLPPEQDPADG